MSTSSVSTTQGIEETTYHTIGDLRLLWVAEDAGPRPLPYNWGLPWVAVPTMQRLHWRTGGYERGVTESPGIPDAVNHTIEASRVHIKGKWPQRSTPSPSECGEIEDGYQEAFDFWLTVQFKTYSEKKYNARAEYFDELPGVSGYFRFLCLHTVTREGDMYVLRRTH
jgi:hypothetical protein